MTQIQLRRDTAANWTAVNPTLAQGEIGVDLTNKTIKLGDGATAWNNLNPLFSGDIEELGNELNTLASTVTGLETSKQNTLTAGTGITISGNEISVVSNLALPNVSVFTDETLPASGTATTATQAGYLYINKAAANVGEYIQVTVSDSSSNIVYSDDKYAVTATQNLKLLVPIPNGCSYTVEYTATGATNAYRFIKTVGG